MGSVNQHSFLNRFVFLTVLTATVACGGRGKEQPAPAAAVAVASPAPEAAGITPFGVPECDTYVRQYLDCIETKVSGEAKDRLMQAFEANRTKWRALATMREGALTLGTVCKAATQKAKEELAVDYGCEF